MVLVWGQVASAAAAYTEIARDGDVSMDCGGELTPYQHHASSHLQALGCESKVDSNGVDLHATSVANWDTFLSWRNFTHVSNNHALALGPKSDASTHFIDFDVPTDAKSCLVHLLAWSTGGYMDVYLQHANGQNLWANRLNIYGPGEVIGVNGDTLYAGRHVMVAAGNMEGSWSRIRFQGRNGGLQHHRCGVPGPYSQPRPELRTLGQCHWRPQQSQ